MSSANKFWAFGEVKNLALEIVFSNSLIIHQENAKEINV